MLSKRIPFRIRIIKTAIEYSSRENLKVRRIVSRRKRNSNYSNTPYTVVRFIDDREGRKITACGRWVENLQAGDWIEGSLQKRRHTNYHYDYEYDWYLENPNKNRW